MFCTTLRLRQHVVMASHVPSNPLIVILGATGTGKSQLAVEIAKQYNGEIINGDAVQMYEGLPIITNKISMEEQQGIPHHLLGEIGLKEETWTVGLFKKRAQTILEEIRSRGRLPILVGGTHYYTQSLLFKENLVSSQDDSEDVKNEHVARDELEQDFPILKASTEEMLAQLRTVDPVMADRWHPNDRRKIMRSLEIYLSTGRKASEVYQEQRERKSGIHVMQSSESEESPLLHSALLLWVHAETDVLKQRLDCRVDKMVERGLIDEVKTLDLFVRAQQSLGVSVDQTRGIWVSIGFKEFRPYLKALEDKCLASSALHNSLSDAVERTKAATRQYSRRQIRWIRIKLMAALAGEKALHRLYVLDGSDLDSWELSVSTPAKELVSAFLKGCDLPPPVTLSSVAANLLTLKQSHDHGERPDLWIREHCAICNMTAVTQEQWDNHLRSRGHRGAVKRKERRTKPNCYKSKEPNENRKEIA